MIASQNLMVKLFSKDAIITTTHHITVKKDHYL